MSDGTGSGQDGYVNWSDLDLMAGAMNNSPGGGTIPEPATIGLLAIGALAVVRRKQE